MLDDRKAAILRAIVEDYIATGHPVGSAVVTKAAKLRVSSATVRNEMMVLEAQGYITQPHTSAGRIPTDLGYRYYVDHLGTPPRLRGAAQAAVADFFARAHRELEGMLHQTTQLLSRLTAHAAVVVGPQLQASRIRDVHLVSLAPDTVLAVVVTTTGLVDKLVLEDLAHDEADLPRASALLCEALRDTSAAEAVARVAAVKDPAVDLLVTRVLEAINSRSDDTAASVFMGGAGNLVTGAPAAEGVQQVIEALEKQVAVVSLLTAAVEEAHLVVRIGSENDAPEMKEWSVVTAPYEAEGRPVGALGVVGPTRMDYAKAISAVEAVSRGLGTALGGRGGE